MNSQFAAFKQVITSPIKYQLFLFTKLPLAFFVGLKLIVLEQEKAVVGVRFKWLNKNPFQSMYFAVLAMAAELSTGILAVAQTYKSQPPVSMLVVKCEGEFYKKAVGNIVFTCADGLVIAEAIQQTINTKQGITINSTAIGKNDQGETVAKFIFMWSFKAKG